MTLAQAVSPLHLHMLSALSAFCRLLQYAACKKCPTPVNLLRLFCCCMQAHYRDYNQMTFARSVLVIHNIAHQGRGAHG